LKHVQLVKSSTEVVKESKIKEYGFYSTTGCLIV
jgi:hypothetical protein